MGYSDATSEGAFCYSCLWQKATSFFHTATETTKKVADSIDEKLCEPMDIDSSQTVDARLTNTRLRAKYKLSRTASNEYHIDVEMDFDTLFIDLKPSMHARSDGAQMKMINKAIEDLPKRKQQWLEKVNQCLTEVKPLLHGPDGEKLSIRAVPATSEVNKISILNSGARNHSKGYAANINCNIIIHEVLHLLGLVDEYTESDTTFSFSSWSFEAIYPCRCIAPNENSIMAYYFIAITESKKRGSSLLKPAHFRMLTKPYCIKENAVYLACAQEAYKRDKTKCLPFEKERKTFLD